MRINFKNSYIFTSRLQIFQLEANIYIFEVIYIHSGTGKKTRTTIVLRKTQMKGNIMFPFQEQLYNDY